MYQYYYFMFFGQEVGYLPVAALAPCFVSRAVHAHVYIYLRGFPHLATAVKIASFHYILTYLLSQCFCRAAAIVSNCATPPPHTHTQALLNKRRLRCKGPPFLRLLEAMRFLEQMLSAVRHLLLHGLAHNDIKPGKIFLHVVRIYVCTRYRVWGAVASRCILQRIIASRHARGRLLLWLLHEGMAATKRAHPILPLILAAHGSESSQTIKKNHTNCRSRWRLLRSATQRVGLGKRTPSTRAVQVIRVHLWVNLWVVPYFLTPPWMTAPTAHITCCCMFWRVISYLL